MNRVANSNVQTMEARSPQAILQAWRHDLQGAQNQLTRQRDAKAGSQRQAGRRDAWPACAYEQAGDRDHPDLLFA